MLDQPRFRASGGRHFRPSLNGCEQTTRGSTLPSTQMMRKSGGMGGSLNMMKLALVVALLVIVFLFFREGDVADIRIRESRMKGIESALQVLGSEVAELRHNQNNHDHAAEPARATAPPLPPPTPAVRGSGAGWDEYVDAITQRKYFVNRRTGESKWDLVTAVQPPHAPSFPAAQAPVQAPVVQAPVQAPVVQAPVQVQIAASGKKEVTDTQLSPFAKAAGCVLGAPPSRVDLGDIITRLQGRLAGDPYGKDLDNTHLGGFITNDTATFEYRMWNWAMAKLASDASRPNILDVGCGMGFSTDYFIHESPAKNGHVLCIEGSTTAVTTSLAPCNVVQQDFTKGAYKPRRVYDFAWSCEMLEHVDEQYMPNYMEAFKSARYAIVTHGVVGQGGFHHTNNQGAPYWIEKFKQYGFDYMPDLTAEGRRLADPTWGTSRQCSEWHPKHPRFNPKCANMVKGRGYSHFHDKGLIFKNTALA